MTAWLTRFVPVAVVLVGIALAVDASQWPGMLLLAAGVSGAMMLLERIEGTRGALPQGTDDEPAHG